MKQTIHLFMLLYFRIFNNIWMCREYYKKSNLVINDKENKLKDFKLMKQILSFLLVSGVGWLIDASTMLCSKDNQTFYRKYSIVKDAEKLYEQVKWIENHKKQ